MKNNIILFPILFLFLILSSTIEAQEIPTALGYASKIAGEEIKYFSPLHEFANTALLTRANGKSPISLQLEIEESESELRTFELLIGHSTGTSSGDREFIFSIDGKELFHFTTSPKEPLGTVKAGRSDDDIAFEFRTLEQDINKDAFGFLRIEIPDRLLNKGELTVVGVNAESRD